MYKVSQTVIDLFNKNYRQIVQISVSGKSGSFTIRESEILQGSLTIDRYSVSGSKIEVGSAVAAELSFNLKMIAANMTIRFLKVRNFMCR